MKSKLCRDTLAIVAPLKLTGDRFATGVIIHVLPTWNSIDFI
jgi:hypothetical protein